MTKKNDWEFEYLLSEVEQIVGRKGKRRKSEEESGYTLDEILKEYGSENSSAGTDYAAAKEVSDDIAAVATAVAAEDEREEIAHAAEPIEELPQTLPKPASRRPSVSYVTEAAETAYKGEKREDGSLLREETPEALRSIMERTVDAAMATEEQEQQQRSKAEQRKKKLRQREMQQNPTGTMEVQVLYGDKRAQVEKGDGNAEDFSGRTINWAEEMDVPRKAFAKPRREPVEIPEPPIHDTMLKYSRIAKAQRFPLMASIILCVLAWMPWILEFLSLLPFTMSERIGGVRIFVLVCALLLCILSYDIFVFAFHSLRQWHFSYELSACIAYIAALADSLVVLIDAPRAAFGIESFCPVAMLTMCCALWGRSLSVRSLYHTFRTADNGDPAYALAATSGGVVKQKNGVKGFYHCVFQKDPSAYWQAIVFPLLIAASVVFALLSTLNNNDKHMFFWNWSVILCASNALGFPFAYSMPFYKISRRLMRCGSAVGGYTGAYGMARVNNMIVTDTDIFPPGTIELGELKLYQEDLRKAVSYAASITRASDSGFAKQFEKLLYEKGGNWEQVSDLCFLDDGGVTGNIFDDEIIFGTPRAVQKAGVPLPAEMRQKSALCLAVNNRVLALFPVKYKVAGNVKWAFTAMRRNRVTPVLAVRDGNITPQLLKRRFGTAANAVFPNLATRIALSGQEQGKGPYALLFREGLMPFAESMVGSKRMCRAVRCALTVSILSSVIGILLSFYLTFYGVYGVLHPSNMVQFLLLLGFASMYETIFVDRY